MEALTVEGTAEFTELSVSSTIDSASWDTLVLVVSLNENIAQPVTHCQIVAFCLQIRWKLERKLLRPRVQNLIWDL